MSASSMEINEDNIPDASVCDQLCKDFAEITKTDEACGHFFLQDTAWDLKTALDRFFEQSAVDEPGAATSKSAENNATEQLKLLSWNIDGLDGANLTTRTKTVCALIKRELPDIVFLQELLVEVFSIIDVELNTEYELISGQNNNTLVPYFTAILLKRDTVRCLKQKILPFPTTMMGRTLHTVQVSFGEHEMSLSNAHLESMKEHSRERMKQLKVGFQTALDVSGGKMAIFGGDLNMRDKELADVGGVPGRLNDAWCSNGSKKFTEFTWDCAKNDNKHFEGRFKPRCRFDRIYYTKDGPFECTDFMLVGMERIRSGLCFPSDHWGIQCTFTIKK